MGMADTLLRGRCEVIDITLLRGQDDLADRGSFESTTSSSVLLITDCGTPDGAGGTTYDIADSADVHARLEAGTLDSFFAATGRTFRQGSNYVSPLTEHGPLVIRSLEVVEHPDKPHAWLARIEETGMGRLVKTGAVPLGGPDLTVNQTTRTRTIPVWRADFGNLVFPDDSIVQPGASGFYFDPTEWDHCDLSEDEMLGVPVDVNTKPINYAVNQRHVTFEYVVRSPWHDWDDAWMEFWSSPYHAALDLSNEVNKRNAEPLFGFGKGSLLLADVAIQPLHHEFKRVSLTFVWDYWKHAEQRPWTTKSGVVAGTDQCETSQPSNSLSLVNLQAAAVWWVQPYLGAFTFGNTPDDSFPANVWEGFWEKFNADPDGYTPAEGP